MYRRNWFARIKGQIYISVYIKCVVWSCMCALQIAATWWGHYPLGGIMIRAGALAMQGFFPFPPSPKENHLLEAT